MKSEEEIRQRIRLWEEFKRRKNKYLAWAYYREGGDNPHPEEILRELGYIDDHLVDDEFYDPECAEIVIRELKTILEEKEEEKEPVQVIVQEIVKNKSFRVEILLEGEEMTKDEILSAVKERLKNWIALKKSYEKFAKEMNKKLRG
ncbi:MAG: hypothetical protein DSO07_12190 [Thermoproteota archaeon]|nr:MAG: hypothetical protein DSO07_12190 [Candidatus Korarchaeota archaeon]